MDETQPPSEDNSETLSLSILHHGTTHTFTFPISATLSDLTTQITETLSIPPSHQKFMISPKTGLLKPPYPDPLLPLSTLTTKRIQLLAPLPKDLAQLAPPPTRPTNTILKPATPTRTINSSKIHAESTYTFHKLIPLAYLPNPERSLRFLERLRDDPGIKAAMAKHRFTVGVLTEMNPVEHTTHESKTLGLNRNHGQVIELRLRTDAYDGYRDYKTIRKTLCHELAHNVHGEHDRKFWDLMKIIETDVEKGDWTRGGHKISEDEFYNPDDSGVGEHVDGGGWTGGEFVLGGSEEGGGVVVAGVSRREAMAKAAEARMRQQRDAQGEKKS